MAVLEIEDGRLEIARKRLDKLSTNRNLPRMKAMSELAKEALELPPPQRLVLARILLDLSDEEGDFSPETEAAWEVEICRRMDEVKTGRARSSSFEDVFERLGRRFSK